MAVKIRGWRAAPFSLVLALSAGCAASAKSAPSSAAEATTVAPAVEPPPTTDALAGTVTAQNTVAMPDSVAPVIPEMLQAGDSGDAVLRLQERLNELKFDVKKPDGYFGDNTKSAIWVYQRRVLGLKGANVTGRVSAKLYGLIMGPLDLPPRRPEGSSTHVEVDLPSQSMVVYQDNNIRLISHMSSGSGEEWCAQPRNVPAWPGATTTTLPGGKRLRRMCGVSITPAGVYKIDRKEKGWYDIPLGQVYNPMFINGGIAIHGYEEVPFKPASHGCIRIPMHIAEYIGDIVRTRDQVFVFDGVKEPEEYGSPAPPMDIPDPTDK